MSENILLNKENIVKKSIQVMNTFENTKIYCGHCYGLFIDTYAVPGRNNIVPNDPQVKITIRISKDSSEEYVVDKDLKIYAEFDTIYVTNYYFNLPLPTETPYITIGFLKDKKDIIDQVDFARNSTLRKLLKYQNIDTDRYQILSLPCDIPASLNTLLEFQEPLYPLPAQCIFPIKKIIPINMLSDQYTVTLWYYDLFTVENTPGAFQTVEPAAFDNIGIPVRRGYNITGAQFNQILSNGEFNCNIAALTLQSGATGAPGSTVQILIVSKKIDLRDF